MKLPQWGAVYEPAKFDVAKVEPGASLEQQDRLELPVGTLELRDRHQQRRQPVLQAVAIDVKLALAVLEHKLHPDRVVDGPRAWSVNSPPTQISAPAYLRWGNPTEEGVRVWVCGHRWAQERASERERATRERESRGVQGAVTY